MLGGQSDKNNIWFSGSTIAFVIVCVLNPVFKTFYQSPEKTLKRVKIYEFLTYIGVHHTSRQIKTILVGVDLLDPQT